MPFTSIIITYINYKSKPLLQHKKKVDVYFLIHIYPSQRKIVTRIATTINIYKVTLLNVLYIYYNNIIIPKLQAFLFNLTTKK